MVSPTRAVLNPPAGGSYNFLSSEPNYLSHKCTEGGALETSPRLIFAHRRTEKEVRSSVIIELKDIRPKQKKNTSQNENLECLATFAKEKLMNFTFMELFELNLTCSKI